MGKIENSRIIVTGGTGFIGSHLVNALVNLHNQVTVIDVKNDPRSLFSLNNLGRKVHLQLVDVRNRKKIFSIFKSCQPQYVFHLAAQAIVDEAYLNPAETLEINIMGAINILEAARAVRGLKCVLVTSSDKAYGKKNEKYRETDPLRGDHPYEVSKSAEDLISNSYFKTYKLPIVITRFGNVYGEGDLNFSRIIPGIMKAMINKETLEIRSNGKFIRDYLSVKDVVDGSIGLANDILRTRGEAFNFGSHETLSVTDLIAKVEHILRKKVKYQILNLSKNEIPTQSLNYSKIKQFISWEPKRSIDISLPQIFDYYSQIL